MSEDEKKLAAEREEMRAKLVARRERDASRILPDVTFTLGGAITYPSTYANPDVSQPECTPETLHEAFGAVDVIRSAQGPSVRDEMARRIVELLPSYMAMGARPDLAPGSMLSVLVNACAQALAEHYVRLEMQLAAACQLPRDILFPEGGFTFRLDGAIKHVEIAPLPRYEP